MLHSGKLPCHGAKQLRRNLAPQRRNDAEEVFYIVHAGNADLLHGEERHIAGFIDMMEDAVGVEICSTGNGFPAGEPVEIPPDLLCHGTVEHCPAEGVLMAVEILFGVHILLHILVHIQMVGRHIGDEGGIRTAAHGDELEAGKLHHSGIFGLDLVDDRQQRRADIAAQMHRPPRPPEQFGDEGGAGGLAV